MNAACAACPSTAIGHEAAHLCASCGNATVAGASFDVMNVLAAVFVVAATAIVARGLLMARGNRRVVAAA